MIISLAATLVVGSFLAPIFLVVAILWATKLLYDLVAWFRTDRITRPKMKFPKKSVVALIVAVLCVGCFGYLLGQEFVDNPL